MPGYDGSSYRMERCAMAWSMKRHNDGRGVSSDTNVAFVEISEVRGARSFARGTVRPDPHPKLWGADGLIFGCEKFTGSSTRAAQPCWTSIVPATKQQGCGIRLCIAQRCQNTWTGCCRQPREAAGTEFEITQRCRRTASVPTSWGGGTLNE
jgi:hypothetical protein